MQTATIHPSGAHAHDASHDHHELSFLQKYIFSSDHKIIGIQYGVTALIFLFMLYSFSSGLTLYWTVQNLLSILQMKLTRAQDVKTNGKSAIVSVSAPSGSRKKL